MTGQNMAISDVCLQNALYKIVIISGTCGVIWYFRQFLLYHTHKRIYAWVLSKIERRVNRQMRREKRKVFKEMHDYQQRLKRGLKVLDVGSGSASNIDFFPYNTELACLEPNPHFVGYIKKNLKQGETVVSAEIVKGVAEEMPFEDNSFDVVVCTLVLCTVSDPESSLKEIHRVLKPDGLYIFLEHVAADTGSFTHRFQQGIRSIHTLIADGCDPSRDTGKLIKQVGFSSSNVKYFVKNLFVAFWLRNWIVGSAIK